MGGFAWVTLATNDSYSLGALVLANSLKQVGTQHQLAVLVTPGVTDAMREKLSSVFDVVQEVNILDSKDEANLRLLKRPELGITFTKLHCWRLTQFDKCVFLDADTLVLQNSDELFDREEFSAAPDVGWPDCFNSGVFVYRPSIETYEKLVQFALDRGSFDGGDQGLLNLYFSDWATTDISKHLPFIYNLCSTACYSYLPAFKQFGGDAKIIHFIGASKPWLQYFNTETRTVQPTSDLKHLQGVLQHWWNIFCSLIHPNLTPSMGGLAGAFAQLTLGTPRTAQQSALDDHLRRQGWEVGNIDYLGRDSFDNIWSKICATLSAGTLASPPSTTEAVPAPIEAQPVENTATEASVTLSQQEIPTQDLQQGTPQSVQQNIPLAETPSTEPLKTEGSTSVESSQCPITSPQKETEILVCPIASQIPAPLPDQPPVPTPLQETTIPVVTSQESIQAQEAVQALQVAPSQETTISTTPQETAQTVSSVITPPSETITGAAVQVTTVPATAPVSIQESAAPASAPEAAVPAPTLEAATPVPAPEDATPAPAAEIATPAPAPETAASAPALEAAATVITPEIAAPALDASAAVLQAAAPTPTPVPVSEAATPPAPVVEAAVATPSAPVIEAAAPQSLAPATGIAAPTPSVDVAASAPAAEIVASAPTTQPPPLSSPVEAAASEAVTATTEVAEPATPTEAAASTPVTTPSSPAPTSPTTEAPAVQATPASEKTKSKSGSEQTKVKSETAQSGTASAASPTPPPRKGSGGVKKSKSKK